MYPCCDSTLPRISYVTKALVDGVSNPNKVPFLSFLKISGTYSENKSRISNIPIFTPSITSIHSSDRPHIYKYKQKKTSRTMEDNNPPPPTNQRVVCCIGDIHGYITKLQNLWANLESCINPSDFETALIIFLGDYCDRGPDTSKVLDFLISLPLKYPKQSHVFLCGNHDFAFGAFLGVLPSPPDGSEFCETWKEYEMNEEREGWYKGEGFENMHLQGRRWAGNHTVKFNAVKGIDYKGSIYDAAPTFESYGVPRGSADLMKAVPDEHKKFLANLVWIHEEDDVSIKTEEGIKRYKLIAVHAGLEKNKAVEQQIKTLKAKDTRIPKVSALSGRKDVWEIPQELSNTPTIIVSGHHAKLHIEGLRLVIDEGGGFEDRSVAAIVLPSMEIIRDTDHLVK